jgi:predicted ATP-dependent serine protease
MSERKKREPRKNGVRMSFQAFCQECGWSGAHWVGTESRRNAWAELRWHKENAEAHKAGKEKS